MRIERKGFAPKLTPRVQRFLREAVGGEELDALQDAEETKADFRCLNGLLAIELKSLEDDASERMNNLMAEFQEQPDWPVFLGGVPFESILQHVDDPAKVRVRLRDRIGRVIKKDVSKANRQLAAYAAAFPRKNLVRVLIIANEDHDVYEPHTVARIIHGLLSKKNGATPHYANIDAVIFLSERHAAVRGKEIAFPIVCVESIAGEQSPWKREVVELLIARWAAWSGHPLREPHSLDQPFITIEPVPEKMRRQDVWELQYKRDRYMSGYTEEMVRRLFDEVMCIMHLMGLKRSPFKPPHKVVEWAMMTFSHLMLEMGQRAIPVTRFPHTPDRLAAAARRLRCPPDVVNWFESGMGLAE